MPIDHVFVSGKSDGGDASLVQPSNWNDHHAIAATIQVFTSSGTYTPTANTKLAIVEVVGGGAGGGGSDGSGNSGAGGGAGGYARKKVANPTSQTVTIGAGGAGGAANTGGSSGGTTSFGAIV